MYLYSLKILFNILNKPTQYISFVAIVLFFSLFLIIKSSLGVYEDVFINSLKGIYPENIVNINSSDHISKYKNNPNIDIKKELIRNGGEIDVSYDGLDPDETIIKSVNIRSFTPKYSSKFFDSIELIGECKKDDKSIYLSEKFYTMLLEDQSFNKKNVYIRSDDEELLKFNVCQFKLDNLQPWLILSNNNAKLISKDMNMYVLYTENKKIKDQLYEDNNLFTWKQFVEYEDVGIFDISQMVSSNFLVYFSIFLFSFVIVIFVSLAKEFENAVFLNKLFGMDSLQTVLSMMMFFFIYISTLFLFIYILYQIVIYYMALISSMVIQTNSALFFNIYGLFIFLAFLVSIGISKKYHRLAL